MHKSEQNMKLKHEIKFKGNFFNEFLVNALLLIWENSNTYFKVLTQPQVKTAYVIILEDNS